MTNETLEQRKERVISLLRSQKNLLIYAALAFILWIGFYIRTRNLSIIRDVTTGLHVPIEPDSFAFLRYSKHILEHGSIMAHDAMRYFPNGYEPASEFSFLSHAVVWLYKFLHLFNSNVTLEFAQVIYPPLAFVIGGLFFFLLIRRLFDWRAGLLATAFLTVIPPYLFRTIAGFSDKEALGMMFFFLTLYLYVASWQSSTLKRGIFLGLCAGFFTGLMALSWGGVQFLFLIVGLFSLYEFVFGTFKDKDLFTYGAWLVISVFTITVLFSTRFTFTGIIFSETVQPAIFAFFVGTCKYIVNKYHFFGLKRQLEKLLPFGFAISIISIALFAVFNIITRGLSSFVANFQGIYTGLLSPYSSSRWGRTVAESHQPYVADWFSQFGTLYFWLFSIGLLLLVYSAYTLARKQRFLVTGAFTLFLASFLASRYSSAPPLDGISPLAQFLYFGSILFLFGFLLAFYLHAYKKKPEIYAKLLQLKREYLFVLVWAFVMLVTARLAVRIVFVFAPVTAAIIAYLFIRTYDLSTFFKHKILRFAAILALVYLVFSPTSSASLPSYYDITLQSARQMGSSYHQQWQVAMKWVRESTPPDAVFAHWWDYGYWVQTEGERATLTDGGNNGGPALNHFMGRNVLTGANATEAHAFLKVKGATHLLIVSDEIGKYGAFSSIGSNQTYDRFSGISAFSLDPSQTMEQRDQTLLLYRGNAAFDEDFLWQDKLLPAYSSGVAAVVIPFTTRENVTAVLQPQAIVVYRSEQISIPLKCVFVDNKEIVYPGEGLDACFQLIPLIQDSQVHVVGGGLFLPRKVWHTLFAHLYLFNQEWDGFKLAYTDEGSIPLALYNGRLAGPIKIWEINSPSSIEYNPHYERLDLPDPRLAQV